MIDGDVWKAVQAITGVGVAATSILIGYVNTKLESMRLESSRQNECLRHVEKQSDDIGKRLSDWQLQTATDWGAFGARLSRLEERTRIPTNGKE